MKDDVLPSRRELQVEKMLEKKMSLEEIAMDLNLKVVSVKSIRDKLIRRRGKDYVDNLPHKNTAIFEWNVHKEAEHAGLVSPALPFGMTVLIARKKLDKWYRWELWGDGKIIEHGTGFKDMKAAMRHVEGMW